MAIGASSAKELVRLNHVERVEDRGAELDMTVVTGAVEGGEPTGRTAERVKIVHQSLLIAQNRLDPVGRVTLAVVKLAEGCYASAEGCRAVPAEGEKKSAGRGNGGKTDTSPLSRGPKTGSYIPPAFGRFRLSKRTGFVTCLTEMRRMSSDWSAEKEMDEIALEMGLAMSIVRLPSRR